MSRRTSKPAGDRFSLRLRETLGKFSDGVHQLGPPVASARIDGRLPASLRPVYELADGIDLFGDLVRLRPLAAIERAGDEWSLGEVEGRRLVCDDAGVIHEVDDDGDRLSVAADLESALVVYAAREGLIVGNDGEWKEVFGDDGEIVEAVQRKRVELARRKAPSGARWLVEAAELALERDGDEAAAIALCKEACAADPLAAGPAELGGLLSLSRGALADGAAQLVAAAERSGAVRRGERAALAAEACRRNGDEVARARLAAMAREVEPSMAARLGAEAELALEAGKMDDADRLAALATAVAGSDEVLPPRVRGRARLRTIR